MSLIADVADDLQQMTCPSRDITTRMNTPECKTPGIEVHEQTLNSRELGYLSGVFEAWCNRTVTEEEFRDAMLLLSAERGEQDG
jgi:hypothetical protein